MYFRYYSIKMYWDSSSAGSCLGRDHA